MNLRVLQAVYKWRDRPSRACPAPPCTAIIRLEPKLKSLLEREFGLSDDPRVCEHCGTARRAHRALGSTSSLRQRRLQGPTA